MLAAVGFASTGCSLTVSRVLGYRRKPYSHATFSDFSRTGVRPLKTARHSRKRAGESLFAIKPAKPTASTVCGHTSPPVYIIYYHNCSTWNTNTCSLVKKKRGGFRHPLYVIYLLCVFIIHYFKNFVNTFLKIFFIIKGKGFRPSAYY